MSDLDEPNGGRGNWRGFKPDTSPVPDPVTPKKSLQEQLDDLDEQLLDLEERRKELQYEVAKEEILDDIENDEEVHRKCEKRYDEGYADGLEDGRKENREETQVAFQEFGGHAPRCLEGALAGVQTLHPLCTCGWNEVATQLERR